MYGVRFPPLWCASNQQAVMDALLRPGWFDCCQKRSPSKADARLLLNIPQTAKRQAFRTYLVPYVFDEEGKQMPMNHNSKATPIIANIRKVGLCSGAFTMGKFKTETEQDQDTLDRPLQTAPPCCTWQDSQQSALSFWSSSLEYTEISTVPDEISLLWLTEPPTPQQAEGNAPFPSHLPLFRALNFIILFREAMSAL